MSSRAGELFPPTVAACATTSPELASDRSSLYPCGVCAAVRDARRFKQTCASIQKFRKQLADKKRAAKEEEERHKREAAAARRGEAETKFLIRARKKVRERGGRKAASVVRLTTSRSIH